MEGNLQKTLLLISCAIFLLCAGCSDDSGTNGDSDGTIMPLAIGNAWHGTYTLYDELGNPGSSAYYRFEISGDTTINMAGSDQAWFFMERTLGTNTYLADDLYRNGTNGIWMWVEFDQEGTEPNLWAKYPASVGNSYLSGPVGNDTVTVMETSENITVPAGNFACYKYKVVSHSFIGQHTDYWWLAPGFGLVKYEEYLQVALDPIYKQSDWALDSLDLN